MAVRVISKVQYPITVPYETDKGAKQNERIQPGRNKVNPEVWKQIEDRLESRLQRGDVRVMEDSTDDLTEREAERLVAGADRTEINNLCRKAKSVDTGQVDGAASNEQEFKTVDQLRKEGKL